MTAKAHVLNDIQKNTEEKAQATKQRNLNLVTTKKNTPSNFFYRVSDLAQLSKIGSSYLEDFKNGIKSFAITSTNYKASQQRTVLALASYFDHMFDMKILIISDSPDKGVFEEVMSAKKVEMTTIHGTNKKLEVNHFYHHFDLVDLNKLIGLTLTDKPSFDFEVIMDNVLKSYDIVFWDTPIINTHKNNSRIFSHAMSYFESLTIIVSPMVSKATDVNEIKAHFQSFGVNVKGVLFDVPETVKEEKVKRWANLE